MLTFGRPPVTGSVAENRAAPDSLAHTADATHAQNGKAGPATEKVPAAGPAPMALLAAYRPPGRCTCSHAATSRPVRYITSTPAVIAPMISGPSFCPEDGR